MTLDTIEWATITKAQAVRLRVAARAREKALGDRLNAGEEVGAAFDAAMLLEEDLHVFIVCGERPS